MAKVKLLMENPQFVKKQFAKIKVNLLKDKEGHTLVLSCEWFEDLQTLKSRLVQILELNLMFALMAEILTILFCFDF